jgi:hypothetical protein
MKRKQAENRTQEKRYAGSFTVEAAVLVPLLVLLFLIVLYELVNLGERTAAECIGSRLLLTAGQCGKSRNGYTEDEMDVREEMVLNDWWFCRSAAAGSIRTNHFLYYTDTAEVSYLPRFSGRGRTELVRKADHFVSPAVFRNRVDFIWDTADRIPAVRDMSRKIKERLADLKRRMTG